MDHTVSDLVQHGVEERFDGGGHGGGGVDGRGDGTQATDTQNRDGEGLTIDYGVGKPRALPTTRTSRSLNMQPPKALIVMLFSVYLRGRLGSFTVPGGSCP